MASFLSQSEKDSLSGVMEDMADTFSVAIVVVLNPEKTVPTPDSSYNYLYGNAGPSNSVTNTPESTTIEARILYNKNFGEEYFSDGSSDSQIRVDLPDGMVRVRIKSADLQTVRNAKRIEFDGQRWSIHSDFRGHGLFSAPQFYDFLVKKMD